MTQRQLTVDQATLLRHDRAAGALGRDLAIKYGVSIDMVYDIVHGKTYQNAGGPIRAPRPKLTPADVMAIRQAHARGVSLERLAAQYSIDRMTVSDVVRGLSWVNVGGPLAPRQQPVQPSEKPPAVVDTDDGDIDEIAIERALEDIIADVPLSVRLTEAERDEVIRMVPAGRRNIARVLLKVNIETWRRVIDSAA
jgi:hypothetical protein